MRSFLALAIFAGFALCPHTALSQQTGRVGVPFSFTVRGKTFPAGSYNVKMALNEEFIDLTSNLNPAKHINVVTMPADPRHDLVVLTFSVEGSTHVLTAIQYAGQIAKL